MVDTTTESLLGTWDTDPARRTSGRDHAGVFSRDGKTLYVASDATNQVIALEPRTGEVLWRMDVPGHMSSPCPATARRPSSPGAP